MYKHILASVVLAGSGLMTGISSAFAGAWTLEKEESGISAYTQFSEELGYNRVKLEMVVDAPVESLVSINTDAGNLNQWMESFDQVEVVTQNTWYDYILYVTYDFPFPYQDRDSLSRTLVYKKDDGSVVVKFLLEDEGKPQTDDYIRMDYIDGAWEFTQLNDQQTKVVYTSLVSPGGEGPKWVINAFSLDVPFTSFQNLREQLKTYQPRSISLDEVPMESDLNFN
ncbi:START domain-containing protein [Litoribrevibacter euphylliae]|uniref:START domain-containing protein n=1 Tax=Litoribrevibacter euphylliae TaxID=1834034 RepID=A0ABV7HBH4_9GAMM